MMEASKGRGRPRSFDADDALDRALGVFWKHGFQSASLQELTEAMGMSKPSLYAAFGDKEALYLKALERYVAQHLARHVAILDAEPDGRKAVAGFLRSVAAMMSDAAMPGGCFIINGTADLGGSTTPAAVELALRNARQASETKLRARLVRAQREGQLAADIRAEEMAALFGAVLAGLGVLAKSGVKPAKLNHVIEQAMALWRA